MNDADRLERLEKAMTALETTVSTMKNALKDAIEDTKRNPSVALGTQHRALPYKEAKMVKDIMENFDFEKVHDVMDSLGWKWIGTKNGVPTVEELRAEANRILFQAVLENTRIATGGFEVVYEKGDDNDPEPFLELKFVLAECEGFATEDE